jgi:hypothetical protein
MILTHLRRENTKASAMLGQSLMQHTLWQGGEQHGLGGLYNEARGWSGLILDRLHIWMTEMNLTLTGLDSSTKIPMGREGDALLVDLVGSDPAAKALMAVGCWDIDQYRVSDVLD